MSKLNNEIRDELNIDELSDKELDAVNGGDVGAPAAIMDDVEPGHTHTKVC